MVASIKIGHLLNSSLWITVLIVRVGCIIEASMVENTGVEDGQSKDSYNNNSDKDEDLMVSSSTFSLSRQARLRKKSLALLPSSSSSSSSSSARRLFSSKNLGTTAPAIITTTSTSMIGVLPKMENDDDTCSGKMDGYFSNYGSDCTSYYFCAAGYQITYVCPPDFRFNEKSKKCEEDAKCLSKGHQNVCGGTANGYYTNDVNSPKYFYCYNNAKVIDLTCDYGKVFNGNKCTTLITASSNATPTSFQKGSEEEEIDLEDISCNNKPNGFYPIVQSGCVKYYFCIDSVKTELHCDPGLIFNTEVCVHPQRYKCPLPMSTSANSISTSSNNSGTTFDDNILRKSTRNEEGKLSHEVIPDRNYNYDTTSLPITTVY